MFSGNQKGGWLYVVLLDQVIKNNFMQRHLWSDENVSTDTVNDSVECRTTHLTSFAVLVDTQRSTATTTTTAESVRLNIWLTKCMFN